MKPPVRVNWIKTKKKAKKGTNTLKRKKARSKNVKTFEEIERNKRIRAEIFERQACMRESTEGKKTKEQEDAQALEMKIYTIQQARQYLGRKRRTIKKMLETGKFPHAYQDTGQWLIPEEDLIQHLPQKNMKYERKIPPQWKDTGKKGKKIRQRKQSARHARQEFLKIQQSVASSKKRALREKELQEKLNKTED